MYIRQIKTHSAPGPDGITAWMLTNFAQSIAPSLSSIFNLSIAIGGLPADWKLSNIIPIPKSSARDDVRFFRPISLLPIVGKILEKHIHQLLLEFMSSKGLLSENQFGFRKGRSTVTPLLLATHHWHKSLENKHQVACVFFDYKKAFDSVPHQSLLNKLYHLQLPSPLIRWIEGYLAQRFQRVTLNGQCSSWLPVRSGVPQGSILGPLLFLSYINDLSCCSLSRSAKLLMFADDVLLYKPITTHTDFIAFQNDVDAIGHWSLQNHLSLNISKTKFMLISRSKRYSLQCPNVLLDGSQLEQVSHFKYLGVWISADLSWSKHIMTVTCKSRRLLGYIFRTFPHCSPTAIMTLYRAQVLPILDYGCIIWDPHFKKDSALLESVQLFATRMATKSWNASAVSLNSKLNLSTLSSRRTYFKVLYVYKFLNGHLYCPPDLFIWRPNVKVRVCHPKQLLQPFAKTSAFSSSYFVSSVKLWNFLPAELVFNPCISLFKSTVKNLYFTP